MAELTIRAMAYSGRIPVNFTYPTAPYFDDVGVGNPRFKYIQKLREQGIAEGTAYRQFSPVSPLQRFQMAVFVVRAFLTEP